MWNITITCKKITNLLLENIHEIHILPNGIVLDRGIQFISDFGGGYSNYWSNYQALLYILSRQLMAHSTNK